MSDKRAYAAQRAFSPYELERCPLPPSRMFLEAEAQLVGELARMAHMDGRRFEGWPTLTLATDRPSSVMERQVLLLRAEVTA